MNKDEIRLLIGQAIYAELVIQANLNGFTKIFELCNPLVAAVTDKAAARIIDTLIEKKIIIENQEVVKLSDEVIKDLAADPITSPLLQIILTGFAAFISHEYPGLKSDSHADKARNYLEHLAKQAKASE